MIRKYVKTTKPSVEAVQFLGDNFVEVVNFCASTWSDYNGGMLILTTQAGNQLVAEEGDWLVKDKNGDLRVVGPVTFRATYEEKS